MEDDPSAFTVKRLPRRHCRSSRFILNGSIFGAIIPLNIYLRERSKSYAWGKKKKKKKNSLLLGKMPNACEKQAEMFSYPEARSPALLDFAKTLLRGCK